MRLYVGDTRSNPLHMTMPTIKSWCVEPGRNHKAEFPEGSCILLDSGAFPDVKRGRVTFEEALARQLAMEAKCSWVAEAIVSYDLLIDEVLDPNGVQKKERWSEAEGVHAVEVTVAAAKYLASKRSALMPRTLVLSCQGVTPDQYEECAKSILEVAEPGDMFRLRRVVHSRSAAMANAFILGDNTPGYPTSGKCWAYQSPRFWRGLDSCCSGFFGVVRFAWDRRKHRHDSFLLRANEGVHVQRANRKVKEGRQLQSLQLRLRKEEHRICPSLVRSNPILQPATTTAMTRTLEIDGIKPVQAEQDGTLPTSPPTKNLAEESAKSVSPGDSKAVEE